MPPDSQHITVLHLSCVPLQLPPRCAAAGIANTSSPGFRQGWLPVFYYSTIKNRSINFIKLDGYQRDHIRHARESPGGYSDKEGVARVTGAALLSNGKQDEEAL